MKLIKSIFLLICTVIAFSSSLMAQFPIPDLPAGYVPAVNPILINGSRNVAVGQTETFTFTGTPTCSIAGSIEGVTRTVLGNTITRSFPNRGIYLLSFFCYQMPASPIPQILATSYIAVDPAGEDRTYNQDMGIINLADWGADLTTGHWTGLAITGTQLDLSQLSEGQHIYAYQHTASLIKDTMTLTVVVTQPGVIGIQKQQFCPPMTGKLTVDGNAGDVVRWERSSNGVNWNPIPQSANKVYNYEENETTYFRVVVNNVGANDVYGNPVVISPSETTQGNINTNEVINSCGKTTGKLSVSGGNGVVKFWDRSQDEGVNWNQVSQSAQYTLDQSNPAQFRSATQYSNCPISYTLPVAINPLAAVGGIVSSTQSTFTCGRATGRLKLEGAQGEIFTWESNSGTSWGELSAVNGEFLFDVISQTSYRVRVEKQGCNPVYSSVYTAYTTTIPGTVWSNYGQNECGLSNVPLFWKDNVGTALRWEHSINNVDWTELPNSSGQSSYVHASPGLLNYYRVAVSLANCEATYTPSVIISISSPTTPGVVRFVSESQDATLVNGVMQFYPVFELQQYVGNVMNWQKETVSGNEVVNSTSPTFNTMVSQTTAVKATVKSGSCDAISSGKAIFVVNKLSEGETEVLDYKLVSEYDGKSYKVSGGEGVSLQEGFSFHANTGQEFYVVLDDKYVALPNDQNYALVQTVMKDGVVNEEDLYFQDEHESSFGYTYFDGIGRPKQKVWRKASPNARDIVVPVAYDKFGRMHRKYLAYEAKSENGHYQPSGLIDQISFYANPPSKVASSAYPFAEKIFESSPLGRVKERGAPGADWQPSLTDNTVKFNYEFNNANEVRLWRINFSGMPINDNQYYSANVLYVLTTTDEHGKKVKTYTDKRGATILKKNINGAGWDETIMIYDDRGLLRYTIQPEGLSRLNGNPDQNFLDLWALQYKYDERGRLVEKKFPGSLVEYIVYDNRDRVVLTQDGNLRQNNKWLFIKYDELNRPIVNGIYDHGAVVTRKTMASLISATLFEEHYMGNGALQGYSNTVFPTERLQPLTVLYYSNYKFVTDLFDPRYQYDFQSLNELGYGNVNPYSTQTKGFLTGMQTRVIDTDTWIKKVTYYNRRGQIIQMINGNHLGGIDKFGHLYETTGKLVAQSSIHTVPGLADVKVREELTYDHVGRILEHFHQLGNGAKIKLRSQHYNALGQLVEKNQHATASGGYLQSTDYRYNIRGWLTSINNAELSSDGGFTNDDGDDLFGFELRYQNGTNIGSTAQYNGNISETHWKIAGDDHQSYSYQYDNSNRLNKSTYFNNDNPLRNGRFDENIGEYDRNGNIKSTKRNGHTSLLTYGLIDDLTYTYSGNHLMDVTDMSSGTSDNEEGFKDDSGINGNDYSYDANGNLLKDENKQISSISYNHLNLPVLIARSPQEKITYLYSANGTKLAQTVMEENKSIKRTDYSGIFVYENGVLQFIQHPEGRIVMTGVQPEYQYNLTDHLGNVRASFTSAPSIQSNTATMEAEDTDENSVFINFSNTRVPALQQINHTSINETGDVPEVVRLNGSYNIKQGPGRSIAVLPGDKIKAEVYVKYLDLRRDEGIGAAALLNYFFGGLGSLTSTAIDGGAIRITDTNTNLSSLFGGENNNDAAPKAYLNCFVMDKDQNPVTATWVGDFVTEDAAITPLTINGQHQKLTLEITISKPGYVYVNVSHDANENIDIYFDDLTVEHIHGPLVQIQDYYAFGLSFNKMQSDQGMLNKYQFNGGAEKEDALQLNLYNTFYRNYDPAIGRYNSMDPLAGKYGNVSAYVFGFNNPVVWNDPTGADPPGGNPGFSTATWKMLSDLWDAVEEADNFTFDEGNGGGGGKKPDPRTSSATGWDLDWLNGGNGDDNNNNETDANEAPADCNCPRGMNCTYDTQGNIISVTYPDEYKRVKPPSPGPAMVRMMVFEYDKSPWGEMRPVFRLSYYPSDQFVSFVAYDGNQAATTTIDFDTFDIKSLPNSPYKSEDFTEFVDTRKFTSLPRNQAKESIMESLGETHGSEFWNAFVLGRGSFMTNNFGGVLWDALMGNPWSNVTFRFKFDVNFEGGKYNVTVDVTYY